MCQDPESSPQVGSTGIGCAINSPSCIKPQCGKVSKYTDPIALPSIISRKDAWYVLKNDVLASQYPNALSCLGPKVSIIVKSFGDPTGSGLGMWLAGEPGANDVNVAFPGFGIEGVDVIPDGSGIEAVSESLL